MGKKIYQAKHDNTFWPRPSILHPSVHKRSYHPHGHVCENHRAFVPYSTYALSLSYKYHIYGGQSEQYLGWDEIQINSMFRNGECFIMSVASASYT